MNTFTCSDFVVQSVSVEDKPENLSSDKTKKVKKVISLKMAEVKHCCDANGSHVSD